MAPTLSQAIRELAKLQGRVEQSRAHSGPMSEVEIARAINFTLNKAARGLATPRELALAQQIHFTLFGTPDIDPEWGREGA